MSHAPALDWVSQLFAAIDAKDVEGFLAFLAPAARFRYGSGPAAVGHAQIGEAARAFFATLDHIEHHLDFTARIADRIIVEGRVVYHLPDSRVIELPFANIMRTGESGLIEDYRIYIDPTPLSSHAEQ